VLLGGHAGLRAARWSRWSSPTWTSSAASSPCAAPVGSEVRRTEGRSFPRGAHDEALKKALTTIRHLRASASSFSATAQR